MIFDPSAPNVQYQTAERKGRWRLLQDLLGGTQAMQAAGRNWLLQSERESENAYRDRLKRTVLIPAYSSAVDRLSGKPFARPVDVEGVNLDWVEGMVEDVDLEGQDINNFGRDALRSAIVYGVVHFLVDYPRVDGGMTLAEERQMRVRPFWELVEAPKLVDWESDRLVPGAPPELTMIRLYDTIIRRKGDQSQEQVERVRQWTRDTVTVWYRAEKGEWEVVEEVEHTLGKIPLVTCYLKQDGYLTGTPPLLSLAELNLAHWDSSSDQRNILRWARLPLLFGKMLDRDTIVAAPNNAILSDNEGGEMKYVEHGGKSIEAGRKDIEELEDRMERLGMEPEVTRTGAPTATARAIDESRAKSDLQAWIRELEAAIERAFRLSAEWVGADLGDNFRVRIFNEFSLTLRGKEDLETLDNARARGDIDVKTYLKEIIRRGVLSEDSDVDAIVNEIANDNELGETPTDQGDRDGS